MDKCVAYCMYCAIYQCENMFSLECHNCDNRLYLKIQRLYYGHGLRTLANTLIELKRIGLNLVSFNNPTHPYIDRCYKISFCKGYVVADLTHHCNDIKTKKSMLFRLSHSKCWPHVHLVKVPGVRVLQGHFSALRLAILNTLNNGNIFVTLVVR